MKAQMKKAKGAADSVANDDCIKSDKSSTQIVLK